MPIDEPPTEATGDAGPNGRLATALAVVAGASYYGFLLAGAVAPSMLGRPAIGHVPWSFVLGAGVIAIAIALTGLYVVVANGQNRRSGSDP